ncbi:type IX secretion system membrane protein PorP/SprF [Cellulophaga sp. HaHaR_3_176]|uniref:PorP/SprF family type IX secretion system membrane protein n=1 Tax=Cellulophaga sp. HaHaR_3_176 TaxID=1942464 RepID=UPI001C20020B|nr:type IX secretion system membrane protein PorP/SprF [Cellulophaga sp. HaHaR_3_176]QWX84308.1 type IX secretion system membrane protein PorP/SprF [Cellulophaga sp. HaHaR_3_176]
MKIHKEYLIAITLFIGLVSNAQQLPQFTQYMYNTISVNPAYAGSREALNVTALHRNQWAGLEGNPQTTTLSIHSPIKNEKIGIGFSYIRDDLGDESSNYIYGDFSYTVLLTSEVKMSFGLKAGFTNYNLNDPDVFDMATSNTSLWNPNFGAGFFIGSNRWYGGISVPRILNTDLNEGEFTNLERNSYYAIGGLVFDVSENTKFKPTVITKFTNGAPVTYDLTASFLFHEKFWLGASYRFNDASNFGAMADYQISKDFRIGYAYDLPTSAVRAYTGGTHEIILIYEFKKPSKGPIKSPRYF